MLIVTMAETVKDYSHLASAAGRRRVQALMFKEDELNLETAFMALTKGITS